VPNIGMANLSIPKFFVVFGTLVLKFPKRLATEHFVVVEKTSVSFIIVLLNGALDLY
jgi:hypothetical protein